MSLLLSLGINVLIFLTAAAIQSPISDTARLCMAIVLAGGLAGLGGTK